jgi:glycosyltransferase involved in cell wall biosynthesis
VETIYAPFATSVVNFLERRGREFDVVYITRYTIADKHLEAVRQYAPQAKIMFCNADLHFLREMREALRAKDPAKMSVAVATREAELRVMRLVDVTLSYNSVEHAVILSHNLDSTLVSTAPWIVEVARDVPSFEARSNIAFLGGFGHPPNTEAVQFFVREVMPLLRRRVPGVSFLIYGSGVPPEIDKLASDDVVVKGFVEDVADVFSGTRVFVAPLLSGAGVKGKVVDALSFGVPSVLSPIAAEGIGLSEGAEAMVARTPSEWVEAIATLYTDAAAWNAMSQRAQAFARRVYSFDRGVEHMRVAVEAVGLFPVSGMAPKRARLGL